VLKICCWNFHICWFKAIAFQQRETWKSDFLFVGLAAERQKLIRVSVCCCCRKINDNHCTEIMTDKAVPCTEYIALSTSRPCRTRSPTLDDYRQLWRAPRRSCSCSSSSVANSNERRRLRGTTTCCVRDRPKLRRVCIFALMKCYRERCAKNYTGDRRSTGVANPRRPAGCNIAR